MLPPETCPCTTAPRGPSSTFPHRLSRATARRIGTAAGSRSGRLLIAVSAVLSLGPAGYAALGPGAPRADNHQAAGATAGRDTTTPNTRLVARFPTRNGAAFLVSADEPASFACSLDGAAYAPCSSAASFTNLGSGWHTFAVRAIDIAGNADPTPSQVRWHASGGH